MKSSNVTHRPYYTACLNIAGRSALVVGGGEVARRKIATLCDCGAKVTVVSPKLDPVLDYMAFQKEIVWKDRNFKPADLEGMFIAIAATDDRDTNHTIAAICKEKDILCNIVDASEECSFIVPSTIDRGPLTIAISTSGISPTLAASIRQELEMAYGEEYGTFLELVSTFRPYVIEYFASPIVRQRIFDRMIASRALALIRNGLKDQAEKELKDVIFDARNDPSLKELENSIPIANQSK
jgi:precorrin-2 dehydrogenase / sirohydrochlorin ferrochelatase